MEQVKQAVISHTFKLKLAKFTETSTCVTASPRLNFLRIASSKFTPHAQNTLVYESESFDRFSVIFAFLRKLTLSRTQAAKNGNKDVLFQYGKKIFQ